MKRIRYFNDKNEVNHDLFTECTTVFDGQLLKEPETQLSRISQNAGSGFNSNRWNVMWTAWRLTTGYQKAPAKSAFGNGKKSDPR